LEIVAAWILLALIVGATANARGRTPIGWFFLAVTASPVVGIVLLLWLPKVVASPIARGVRAERRWWPIARRTTEFRSQSQIPVFKAEAVFAGIPYRLLAGGAVQAMMPGGLVQFRSVELFRAAAARVDYRDLEVQ
jgi:hypothetical protein